MNNCSFVEALIIKGDKFFKPHCPKNEIKEGPRKRFFMCLSVGTLMYFQVCTRFDIAYVISVLGEVSVKSRLGTSECSHRFNEISIAKKILCLSSVVVIIFLLLVMPGRPGVMKSTSSYVFIMAGGVFLGKVKTGYNSFFYYVGEDVACYEVTIKSFG